MNRRSKEYARRVGLAAAVLFGASACSGASDTLPAPTASTTSEISPYTTAILQQAAARILALAEQSPTRTEGKPPYSLGFTEFTSSEAAITYTAQTKSSMHDPAQTEALSVQQTGLGVPNFDLEFTRQPDGTWNSYCTSIPSSGESRNVAVIGERSVELNGEPTDIELRGAQAILQEETMRMSSLAIEATPFVGSTAPALPDPCHINIG